MRNSEIMPTRTPPTAATGQHAATPSPTAIQASGSVRTAMFYAKARALVARTPCTEQRGQIGSVNKSAVVDVTLA